MLKAPNFLFNWYEVGVRMLKYVARNQMISESGRVQRNHKKCGQDSLGMLRSSFIVRNWLKSWNPFSVRWYKRLPWSEFETARPWPSRDLMYTCMTVHERFALYMMCVGFSAPAPIARSMSQNVSIRERLVTCDWVVSLCRFTYSCAKFVFRLFYQNRISNFVISTCCNYGLLAEVTVAYILLSAN